MNNLMEERIRAALERKKITLSELELQVKSLRKEMTELEFFLGGSDKGREDNLAAITKTNRSDTLTRWTEDDDTKIIEHIRAIGHPEKAVKVSHDLAIVLHRNPIAVRQHIRELCEEGKLKAKSSNRKLPTAPILVEAK